MIGTSTKHGNTTLSVRGVDLGKIYAENVAAKIFQVAQRGLKQKAPLPTYPHTVPQDGTNAGCYGSAKQIFGHAGSFQVASTQLSNAR